MRTGMVRCLIRSCYKSRCCGDEYQHCLSDPVVCSPLMFVFLSIVQEVGLLGISLLFCFSPSSFELHLAVPVCNGTLAKQKNENVDCLPS